MVGTAWARLSTATRYLRTRAANGRVSTIPSGTATRTTRTVDSAVSWTCSQTAVRSVAAFRDRASMLSSSRVLT